MADVAVNGNGNGQAVAAVAFGAHPDDDEIAEIDDAVIGADTHADYNRTMAAMEEYFAEKKPSVMFPAAHGQYGGRVNVERMTALDFKRCPTIGLDRVRVYLYTQTQNGTTWYPSSLSSLKTDKYLLSSTVLFRINKPLLV